MRRLINKSNISNISEKESKQNQKSSEPLTFNPQKSQSERLPRAQSEQLDPQPNQSEVAEPPITISEPPHYTLEATKLAGPNHSSSGLALSQDNSSPLVKPPESWAQSELVYTSGFMQTHSGRAFEERKAETENLRLGRDDDWGDAGDYGEDENMGNEANGNGPDDEDDDHKLRRAVDGGEEFKLNVRLIASMVQSRFTMSTLEEEKEAREVKKQRGYRMSLKPEASNHCVKELIEKFGDIEINEGRKFMIEEGIATQLTDPHKIFQSNLGAAGSDDTPKSTTNKFTQMSLFQLEQSHAEDKKSYLEDKISVSVFDIEVLNYINILAEGIPWAQVSSFAFSRNNSKIVLMGLETGGVIEIITTGKGSVKKHQLSSKVSAVGVSSPEEYLVAGTVNSELLFKRTEGRMAKKTISNLNDQRINHIVFIGEHTVLVGTHSAVFQFLIKSYGVMLETSMLTVIPIQPTQLMQITCLSYSSGVAVAAAFVDRVKLMFISEETKDYFRVHQIGEDIVEIERENSHPNMKWPPCVYWIVPERRDMPVYLTVFWADKVYLIKYEGDDYQVRSCTTLGSKAVWGTVLEGRLIAIITPQLEIEFISFDNIFANTLSRENIYQKFEIPKNLFKDPKDQNYMLKYKDLLENDTIEMTSKVPFFQFFRNRVKDTRGELIMVTDIGFVKHKIASYERMIENYVISGQLVSAVKLMNNIFLKRIAVTPVEKETIRKIVPAVLIKYLERTFQNRISNEELKQILDIVLESLIYSDNLKFAFTEVQPKFGPELFWQEISSFIKQRRINTIPIDYLYVGSKYLSTHEIVHLLGDINPQAAENGDADAYVSQVLNILKRKAVWILLYKLCIMFPTTVVSALLTTLLSEQLSIETKEKGAIVEEVIDHFPQDISFLEYYFTVGKRKMFFRLYWLLYLIFLKDSLQKAVKMFGDVNDQLTKNIPLVFSKALEWVLEPSNTKILLELNPQLYFELIYIMINNSVLLRTQFSSDVVRQLRQFQMSKAKFKSKLNDTASKNAIESLVKDSSIFAVPENILLILEDVVGDTFAPEIGFLVVKILNFSSYESKYDNVEWICYYLQLAMSQKFKENRLWVDFKPLDQDTFEDLVLEIVGKLKGPSIKEMKEEIGQNASRCG